MSKLFEKYTGKIKNLPDGKLSKGDILNDNFLLAEHKRMKIYYAPHNEYQNKDARVVIVGICPGWTQTEIAYKVAKKDLDDNLTVNEIFKHCKVEARFAGSMRKNLIDMLDETSLPDRLGVSSISLLFENNDLLHTTSLIPYPVFIDEKNYTGHTPSIIESEFLMEYVQNHFFEEIREFKEPPLIIPLGKAVEDVLKLMVEKNIIEDSQCLFGFPHPSGANGHRKDHFNQNKDALMERIDQYFLANLK